MRVLLIIALSYAGLGAVLFLARNKIIFPIKGGGLGDPAHFGLTNAEVVRIPTTDSDTLAAWLLLAPGTQHPAPVLLWFHGNAETVQSLAPVLREFRPPGVAVLALDYRGYGASTGRASVAGSERDVLAVWAWITTRGDLDSARVVVYGRSIGAGPAVALASQRPCAGLILESAFTSLGDMVRAGFPMFPRFLAGGGFDNLARIGAVRCPILLIHGDQDGTIPYRMGRRLLEAAGDRGELWTIRGAGHNETYDVGGDEYVRRVKDFVSRVTGDSPPR